MTPTASERYLVSDAVQQKKALTEDERVVNVSKDLAGSYKSVSRPSTCCSQEDIFFKVNYPKLNTCIRNEVGPGFNGHPIRALIARFFR